MKIGVLGGSFDPPHNGHLYVAKNLLKHNYCQKIILMPLFKHPFDKPLTNTTHRLAMTKLLALHAVIPAKAGIQQSTRFPIKSGMTKARIMNKLLEDREIKASDLEIKRKKISYTIDTLNALKIKSPKDEFVWIIGSDQVKDFTKWKKWREILEKFGLIVIPRSAIDISSSEIRERIKKGLEIDNLVPKKVKSYIIKHKLYR